MKIVASTRVYFAGISPAIVNLTYVTELEHPLDLEAELRARAYLEFCDQYPYCEGVEYVEIKTMISKK